MKNGRTRLALLFLLLAFTVPVIAEDEPAAPVFGAYEPNVAYPFGRPNPKAPAELSQFAFMIGINECMDETFNADGSSEKFPARWNAHYFLNGYGIQDQYWTPGEFVTSNIRIFDSKSGKWKVTFFTKPGYGSGAWEGEQLGSELVMHQFSTAADGSTSESRLTFYDISDGGFEWKAETVRGDTTVIGWTSSCHKVQF